MDILESVTERLKAVDPDRYRAALFAPKAARNTLWVLYAFHLELAKVPELVSEPMIGAIRYQWWRDALDEIYSNKTVRTHEVTTPLAALIREHAVPRFRLDRLIDGRERDLDPTPFPDIDAARDYCRQTSGVLMQLSAGLLDPECDDAAVGHFGEAWGLVGLARAWNYYNGTMLSRLSYADICMAAQESLEAARGNKGTVSPSLFPAIAYSALVPGYLKRLTAKGYDPEEMPVSYGRLSKQGRMVMASLTGRL